VRFPGGLFMIRVGCESWYQTTRVPGLSVRENRMILRLLVLAQYERVTDGPTDTPPIAWLSATKLALKTAAVN